MSGKISTAVFSSVIGPIGIAASEKGLLSIELRCPKPSVFMRDMEKTYKAQAVTESKDKILRNTEKQIIEYLSGKRKKFDVALDLRAAPFGEKVLKALMNVPFGKTVTYGELARRSGNAKAARAVGRAVGSNPLPIIIPCHRVIGADGSMTGFSSGLDIKVFLLDLEKACNT